MHAMRQSCRPKHQTLVLKCYPKFQKTAVDVKPNSSELSYLLYYASTRRGKIQKLVVFLEKRTSTDVRRGRMGYVWPPLGARGLTWNAAMCRSAFRSSRP